MLHDNARDADKAFVLEVLHRSRYPPAAPDSQDLCNDRLCYCAICNEFFISRMNLVMHWNRDACKLKGRRVTGYLDSLTRAQRAALLSRFEDL